MTLSAHTQGNQARRSPVDGLLGGVSQSPTHAAALMSALGLPVAEEIRRPPRPGRMLMVTAGWGACFVAIRYGLPDAPLLWFAALRALLAGAALLTVGYLTRRPVPPRKSWPGIGLLGLVNVTVAFAAMFAGTAGVTSGVAAVLANAQPLLIVLPAWLLYRERPERRALVGLLVGFAGLIVAATPTGAGGGALLSLGAAAAITAGTLLARRLSGVDVVMLSGWQFLLGGLALAVWAGAAEGAPAISWTPRFVAALTFLALVGTAATYLIWFTEVQRVALVSLSAWTMLTPVFGIVFGWLLLSDRLSGQQAIGVGLVLAAMPIILLPHRRHRPGPDNRELSPAATEGTGTAINAASIASIAAHTPAAGAAGPTVPRERPSSAIASPDPPDTLVPRGSEQASRLTSTSWHPVELNRYDIHPPRTAPDPGA